MQNWLRYLLLLLIISSTALISIRFYEEFNQGNNIKKELQVNLISWPDRLPEFSLSDIDGELRSISNWSKEPLLINFWATWCAPCRREMPLLETLHKERSKTGMQVLGIAIDRQEDVVRYVTQAGITYPILWGEEEALEISNSLGVTELALPFTLLVTGDGQILTLYVGELMREELAFIADISSQVATGKNDVETARRLLSQL
ncbi:MAG: TlpA disulfide reductase family protein [Pseudomonadota bacterium]|nr:TlpA disulfide reductase family protein [Pseudomonadota bacterium]